MEMRAILSAKIRSLRFDSPEMAVPAPVSDYPDEIISRQVIKENFALIFQVLVLI